jgi:hypothetical protein
MRINVGSLISYLQEYDPELDLRFGVGDERYDFGFIKSTESLNLLVVHVYEPTGPAKDD